MAAAVNVLNTTSKYISRKYAQLDGMHILSVEASQRYAGFMNSISNPSRSMLNYVSFTFSSTASTVENMHPSSASFLLLLF